MCILHGFTEAIERGPRRGRAAALHGLELHVDQPRGERRDREHDGDELVAEPELVAHGDPRRRGPVLRPRTVIAGTEQRDREADGIAGSRERPDEAELDLLTALRGARERRR